MSKAKHTPGPWHIGGTFNPDSPNATQNVWGPRARPEDQSGELVASKCKPANAEFIVRACNSFDDLLAACQAVEAYLENLSSGDLPGDQLREARELYHRPLRNKLQAAIAKATGGTP
jgi:hypothetical protein